MDHSVIADPAMARALLSGEKTQMRVLAGSALATCQPGTTIWVREAWIAGRTIDLQDYVTTRSKAQFAILFDGWRQYQAGYGVPGRLPREDEQRWLPPMQMPRWAARIALEVAWTRRETLQQITRADIRAEGARPRWGGLLWRWPPPVPGIHGSARTAFARYWDTLHATQGERWEDNPDVVVLGFSLRQECSADH